MGINKGKGAAYLRRKNSDKKRAEDEEKLYQQIQEMKKEHEIPDVSFEISQEPIMRIQFE